MTRISLADDHEIFLQGLKSLLKQEKDLDVVSSNRSGQNAWLSIQLHKPDIAVIDYRMPGMNGIEIAKEIKRVQLSTKVILLTMHDSPILLLEAQEAEVSGYILKETAFENLISAINVIRNGGSFLPTEKNKSHNRNNSIRLSERERLVITAIAEGHTTKEIASILNIKPKTVETYRGRISEKLDLHTIADMTRYAIRMGFVK